MNNPGSIEEKTEEASLEKKRSIDVLAIATGVGVAVGLTATALTAAYICDCQWGENYTTLSYWGTYFLLLKPVGLPSGVISGLATGAATNYLMHKHTQEDQMP